MNINTKTLTSLLAIMGVSLPLTAQEPSVSTQDYTSSVSIVTAGKYRVKQQVGTPLAAPVLVEGIEAGMMQGMLGSIADAGLISGVADIIYANDSSVKFSLMPESLTISIADTESAHLIIADASGHTMVSTPLSDSETSVSLLSFSHGTYAAAVVKNNRICKTFKFVLK